MSIEHFVNYTIALVINFAPKILLAAVSFFVGIWVSKRIIKILKTLLSKSSIDPTISSFLINAVYIALVIVVVIGSLTFLGFDTTSLVAILGAAGIAIGLSLKDSLSNLASGILILFLRPFNVGNFVEVSGVTGVVEAITLFTTNIRMLDNKVVIIPNKDIMNEKIVNFSINDTRRLDIIFGIGYGCDIKLAKETILNVLNSDERVLKESEILVGVESLGDSSVNLLVRFWVKSASLPNVKYDIIESVKLELDKAKISIPFPQREIRIVK